MSSFRYNGPKVQSVTEMRKSAGNQDALLIALGEAIRCQRIKCGMSQHDLALDAGVHRTYISDIERGSRNLTVLTLNRLASALGTTAGALYRQADVVVNRIACNADDLSMTGD